MLLALVLSPAFGFTVSVSVTDNLTGAPVAGASITVGSQPCTTSFSGECPFEVEGNALESIYVYREGFFPVTMQETLSPNVKTRIMLERSEPFVLPSNDTSMSLAIVIDKSGSMEEKDFLPSRFDAAKAAAKQLVSLLPENDFVGVVAFDTEADVYSELSADKAHAASGVDSVQVGGGTQIEDGIGRAIELLENASGQKSIAVLSDGCNCFNAFCIEGKDGNPFEHVGTLVERGIRLYTIGMGKEGSEKKFCEDTLILLANQTGGRYFKATEVSELQDVFQSLAAESKGMHIVPLSEEGCVHALLSDQRGPVAGTLRIGTSECATPCSVCNLKEGLHPVALEAPFREPASLLLYLPKGAGVGLYATLWGDYSGFINASFVSAEEGKPLRLYALSGNESCDGENCLFEGLLVGESRTVLISSPGYAIEEVSGDACSFSEQSLVCAPPASVTVRVQPKCVHEAECGPLSRCLDGVCHPVKTTVLVIPVNWRGGYDALERSAARATDYFLERVPLTECADKFERLLAVPAWYGGSWDNVRGCTVNSLQDCEQPGAMVAAVYEVSACAKEYAKVTGEKFDYVAGITDSNVCGPAAGWGITTDNVTVMIESSPDGILTHELGHKLGLAEQYCDCSGTPSAWHCSSDPKDVINPLSVDYGCDADGGCCSNSSKVYEGCNTWCDGNLDRRDKGERSVMSNKILGWWLFRESGHFADDEYGVAASFANLTCE